MISRVSQVAPILAGLLQPVEVRVRPPSWWQLRYWLSWCESAQADRSGSCSSAKIPTNCWVVVEPSTL